MEKRTLIAILLMAGVLAISQYFLVPTPPKEGDGKAEAPGKTPPTAPASPGSAPPGGSGAAAAPGLETVLKAFAAPGNGTVSVETPLYELTFDRRGGVITHAALKHYPSFVESTPVELVPHGLAFFQRTIRAGDRALDLMSVEFQVAAGDLLVDERPDSLVLTGTTPDGASITQIYVFEPASYAVGYRIDADGAAPEGAELVTRLGPRLRSNEKSLKEDIGNFAAVARVGEEVHTVKGSKEKDLPETFEGSASWAGVKSKYFLAALIADGEPFDRVDIGPVPGDSLPGVEVAVSLPLERGRAGYRLYLGPQDYRSLAAAGAGLEDVNQYGWSWIRWLVQPVAHVMLRILLWMHGYIHNYGVVLIIFGVAVRLLMWPLTQKSFESMQRMQAIQPEINRLRERYKNDPQKMQQELMRLYRERGVNPLGGCLPNLLPLPVLFALFFVFQGTIEFRGAPFVGWIHDLSRPDPFYVLPVLMGVLMFVQQKLTTTAATADNPQMKMMTYFMPAFLTFIFLNLASGLVLYYTVSQVLTLVQQLLLKRKMEARGAAAAPSSG
jgi:YidC/Oxa1 family membrane protein insertase